MGSRDGHSTDYEFPAWRRIRRAVDGYATAIVRVIVPIDRDTRDNDAAQRTAVDFVKTFYGAIRQNLPR